MVINPKPCMRARAEYCSALPGDERAERCWQAVRYFEERKAEAEAGCVLPSGERVCPLTRMGRASPSRAPQSPHIRAGFWHAPAPAP